MQGGEGAGGEAEAGVEDAEEEGDEGVGFADEGGEEGAVGMEDGGAGEAGGEGEDVVFGDLVIPLVGGRGFGGEGGTDVVEFVAVGCAVGVDDAGAVAFVSVGGAG